jgi:hypothetical protein
MNSDYRISVGFFRHHKTRKLQKRLGSDGVLALLKLWGYAAEFRADGDLSEMSAEDIELAIDWMKETPLIATLVEIGFIDGQEGRYCLHEWGIHNPWACVDEARSDGGRLSCLFRKNPIAAQEFKAKGRTGITKEEYEIAKNMRNPCDRSANAQDSSANRSANAPISPAPAPTPTPVPTPIPIPAPKEAKAKSKAKERAPAPATPLPADFAITPELQAWADQKGYGDLTAHLDCFKDKAQAKGYQYTDWNAAFRNAVRDDWAGLRKPAITAATPLNGARYPPLDKNARLLAGNQSAIEEWLGDRSHETHVIEGECHEVH